MIRIRCNFSFKDLLTSNSQWNENHYLTPLLALHFSSQPFFQFFLFFGSGILARGHDRPGVQVGPETNQCVDIEVETRDAYFSSSMQRVYYHFARRAFAIGITGEWWNHSASYVRIPTSLKDIRLLLDQQSDTQDPTIRVVIPDEYFQNPNTWHVKVLLVNYATVEMHQSDRVLRQFRFRQLIPVAPEVFNNEHKVDLRQLNTDWPRYWSYYIEMWENRYDYIPTREPIIVPELACVLEYMPWFRIHGKPYLLSEEESHYSIKVGKPLNTYNQIPYRRNHNPRRKSNQRGIQHRPVDDPSVALILTATDIEFF
ncbi:hypothetical protein J1N35_035230 [Gossypium stocksii]|uniref:Aminotransferase-like plant mobile domain-containing protein n=1 Tax=Gossypium stocksii TaxID=47602 RepID=A0A9D3UTJ5_9ROSI|nr:hypothetical protein J1N35_035230 [Gossypium stocksii]